MRQEISIHAPRTGSDAQWYDTIQDCIISIHAPRTGSDAQNADVIHLLTISIHAPRTGSDTTPRMRSTTTRHFNPRSPHGERHCKPISRRGIVTFQSTLPARGATSLRFTTSSHTIKFQSTLPARGATTWQYAHTRKKYFNPRSPHGERQRKVTILSIRIIGFAQKVYHKTVLLRISLAENAVILPKRPRNPVRTSLQKAGGLRFARAIRAARPYSISSPSGA